MLIIESRNMMISFTNLGIDHSKIASLLALTKLGNVIVFN